MDIYPLRALVNEDFEAVNQLIIDKTTSSIQLLDELTNHIFQSGGKRLRPLLVLLASHACDYQGHKHILLAAMIEFFHTATLLHDDVVDDSHLRRGKKTAHTIWGSKASILVGDYLFTQYMQLMIKVGDLKIMQLLTDMSDKMGCGELKQLSNRHTITITLEEYFEVISAKTSMLFAAAASIGALVSDAPETIQQGLYTYGLHLGNAFQVIDDSLDYCSDKDTLGKNIGDDLADGKTTLPLMHVLTHGTPTQQALVKKSIEEGSLSHLHEICEAISETNAIDYTRTVAATESDLAITALHVLPDSPYKTALADLAKYAIYRSH